MLEVLHRCVDCLVGVDEVIPNGVAFAKETAGMRVDKEVKATDADAGRRRCMGARVRPGPSKNKNCLRTEDRRSGARLFTSLDQPHLRLCLTKQ